jgi:hypothetical protein
LEIGDLYSADEKFFTALEAVALINLNLPATAHSAYLMTTGFTVEASPPITAWN